MDSINRDSPIPVYYQIQQDLLNRISRGEWKLGDLMPSESKLIAEYDVSRVTLRQALAELEKDGIIKRYRGKGAYIKGISPKPYVHELKYRLVSQDQTLGENSGDSMTADVLAVELIPDAYPDVREKLHLPEEKPEAIYLKRLFKLNGKPIAIGKSWLPSYLLPGFRERGMVNNSLTQTLKANYGLVPEMINDYIEVVRCTASEAKLLSSTADTPLLVVKGISLLKNGTPIEYSSTSWLGDCVRFNINLKFSELG